MGSLEDFLLNFDNIYYKLKYMTPQTQRRYTLYFLCGVALLLSFMLLVPATNFFNYEIIVFLLVLVAAFICLLLYQNFYEGYYYNGFQPGIQRHHPRSMATPYGEQTVREVFQDTMRHMETSGKKSTYGSDVFPSTSQLGLHHHSYYGTQQTPFYGAHSTPNQPFGTPLGGVAQPTHSHHRRPYDALDSKPYEQPYGSSTEDMRNWPRLGGLAYPTARDVSPTRGQYQLQTRQEIAPRGRGYNDVTYPMEPTRKASGILFSQPERSASTLTARRDVPSPSLSPIRSSSQLRSYPKSPNLKSTISSPLRKGISGPSYAYDNYENALQRETIEKLNQERETEAERILTLLGIHPSSLVKYKENCHQWFCKYLIELILKASDENLRDLNSKLGAFGRILDEYEILAYRREEGTLLDTLQQPWRPPVGNNFYKPVTLDELINYEYSLQRGGPFWNLANPTKQEEALKIHNELRTLIKKRIYLENYFEIAGFRTTDTRRHIMWRMYLLKENFHKNFQYTFGEITLKYPTDTQILANIFFKYLSLDVLRDNTKELPGYKRTIAFDNRTDPIYERWNEQDVYFKQSNIDGYEPHYDLYLSKELWTVLPGPDNLFYATFLFLYVLKIKKNKVFGSEPNQELQSLIDLIIPSI